MSFAAFPPELNFEELDVFPTFLLSSSPSSPSLVPFFLPLPTESAPPSSSTPSSSLANIDHWDCQNCYIPLNRTALKLFVHSSLTSSSSSSRNARSSPASPPSSPSFPSLHSCGKCKTSGAARPSAYCSSECAKADWPAHKKRCEGVVGPTAKRTVALEAEPSWEGEFK